MTEAIVLRGVHKRYRDAEVLRGVDLGVAPGEVLALLGPSGSGKSTLLRCVNGLEAHDAGTLTVLGVEAPRSDVPPLRRERAWLPLRRRIGFVFQAFHLYPHLCALDNVTLAPRRVLGRPADQVEATARTLLARVGLGERGDAMPRDLSGGQRQRVAIARALAMDPEMIGEVLDVIRDLAAEHARTILLVTHEVAFAREAADRVAFLDGGEIVEVGPAAQVLAAPTHARTKAFLERLL